MELVFVVLVTGSIIYVSFFDKTDREHAMRFRKIVHQTYMYNIHRIVKVVDGDTFDVVIDLGFNIYIEVRVRLAGIDTPEMSTALGEPARLFSQNWLNTRTPPVTIKTTKSFLPDGAFGRWLGEVACDGVLLSEELRKAGHVK